MNRSAILSLLLLALLLLSCCRQSHQSSCLIMGTMEDHTLDGKTIYLVPLVGPHDAAHVDSTTIENARASQWVKLCTDWLSDTFALGEM